MCFERRPGDDAAQVGDCEVPDASRLPDVQRFRSRAVAAVSWRADRNKANRSGPADVCERQDDPMRVVRR